MRIESKLRLHAIVALSKQQEVYLFGSLAEPKIAAKHRVSVLGYRQR